ncbi:MAG: DUF6093 family protein [Actinoplanes sp.]
MNRDDLVAEAQAFAEEGMVDTCTIQHVTGENTDADGNVTPTYSTVYTGSCRVQQQQPYAERNDAGQAYQLLLRLEIQLPMSVTGISPDDVVTIVTSRDADLVGRQFSVRDLAHKTDASSRRVQCMEITS